MGVMSNQIHKLHRRNLVVYKRNKCLLRWNLQLVIIVFFKCQNLVHYTFLPRGQIVNFEFCLTILQHKWEAAQKKQLELWWEHTWYSPGLFPAEFLLFLKLKVNFKGCQFESVGEIQEKMVQHLPQISSYLGAVLG